METEHRIYHSDSRDMADLDDNSVEMVVTSPSYPMIEMWDDLFTDLNPAIGPLLENGSGQEAFELMHQELDRVWSEVGRVLVDGGIACINIGDATRKLDGSFRVYPNHSRIIDSFEEIGFEPLPEILWRKPTNSAAKFMGSGMIAPNAYVTLEHEYVLVFRNGKKKRDFEPGSTRRYQSAYFWEERNQWFSDIWEDVRAERQLLEFDQLRERSAAYPFELPYRLVNMYSVYGDTVLDPFWGTGTTSIAAMVAGRNSVGVELDEGFSDVFSQRVADIVDLSKEVVTDRVESHLEFVERKSKAGDDLKYESSNYDFPVVTKQEKQIQLFEIDEVNHSMDGYEVSYDKAESGSWALNDASLIS